MTLHLPLENSYAALPGRFYTAMAPTPVAAPALVKLNAALAEELSNGTFQTVVGEVKLEDNQLRDLWWVGQWQDGAFVAVNPADKQGAASPVIPKPEW